MLRAAGENTCSRLSSASPDRGCDSVCDARGISIFVCSQVHLPLLFPGTFVFTPIERLSLTKRYRSAIQFKALAAYTGGQLCFGRQKIPRNSFWRFDGRAMTRADVHPSAVTSVVTGRDSAFRENAIAMPPSVTPAIKERTDDLQNLDTLFSTDARRSGRRGRTAVYMAGGLG